MSLLAYKLAYTRQQEDDSSSDILSIYATNKTLLSDLLSEWNANTRTGHSYFVSKSQYITNGNATRININIGDLLYFTAFEYQIVRTPSE